MNQASLDLVLAGYPPEARPVSSIIALGNAGGLSGAELWRFHSLRGPLVLRAWPPHGTGRPQLEQVHRWLSLAAALPFIAVPLADSTGHTIQEHDGRLWELAPWLPGAADSAHPPPPTRLEQAFAGLAEFHARLASAQIEDVSPGFRERHQTLTGLVRGGFDRLDEAVNRRGGAIDEPRAAARRWLSLARAAGPGWLEPLARSASQVMRLQPVLRDARPEHFLFEGARLSGLVDYGAMGVDSVATDLARLMGLWLEGDPRARALALAAYERIRPLHASEAAAIPIFLAANALLIGERWVRWHYVEHRRFDDPRAVSDGLARGLAQLERLVSATSP